MRKWTNSLIALLLLGVLLSGACSSAKAETTTATVIQTKTVTVTSAAATTTTSSTAVVPTTTAPPPTTTAVNWPMQITGKLSVSPANAPVGATVTVSGTEFAPNAKFDLMWQDVKGSWDVKNGEYFGRIYKENWITLGPVQTDAQSGFKTTFTVPEGFGFTHDLVVLEGGTTGGTIRGKLGFNVDMKISIDSTSGPLGSPITVSISGMGWRDYENSWMLLYDNKYTGVLTTTTTHGMGKAVIPATGGTGKHIIQVLQGSFTFAFMNIAQSPFPKTPTWTFAYTVTDGAPIMPPAFNTQSNAVVKGTTPAATGKAQVWTDVYLAPVGTPMNILGRAFPAGAKVDLFYWGMTGNRVDGKGYEKVKKTIGAVTATATGDINFAFTMPDTHGGEHILFAEVAGTEVANTTFNLTPSAVSITPSSGPVGTIMDIQLKGLGWTVEENNYYMTVDNDYVGYTCGFNNYGTVDIMLPIAGTPGWHYVDFYPGVYKGTEPGKIENYRVPYLTYTDHPGEKIPVFHYAFLVTG
jgi:hypothetical protein